MKLFPSILLATLLMGPAFGAQRRSHIGRDSALIHRSMARSSVVYRRIVQANRLLALDRDLGRAESILWGARALENPGDSADEALTELYEREGRWERARATFRPVVYSSEGVRRNLPGINARLMRYVLLCRKSGRSDEATAAWNEIHGRTPWEKAVAAALDADESRLVQWRVALWTETVRTKPDDVFCRAHLLKARQDEATWRTRRIAEARKAFGFDLA